MTSQQSQDELSTKETRLIRMLLVDDNARFLELIASLLQVNPRFEIVGKALSGSEALAEIGRLQPDLVLIDLAMPDFNGLVLTRYLKKQPNPPRIVIVTTYEEQEYRQAAELARADGFVAKVDLGLKLLPLIEALEYE